jgi:hypothetical protein
VIQANERVLRVEAQTRFGQAIIAVAELIAAIVDVTIKHSLARTEVLIHAGDVRFEIIGANAGAEQEVVEALIGCAYVRTVKRALSALLGLRIGINQFGNGRT